MFRQTIFGRILDCNLAHNGQLIHHLLLREVIDEILDIISFNLFRNRVSFSKYEFDFITRFRLRMRDVHRLVNSNRLKSMYFDLRMNKKQSKVKSQFLALDF